MKFYASLLCIILVLVACKNKDKSREDDINFKSEKSVNNDIPEFDPKKFDAEDDYSDQDSLATGSKKNNPAASDMTFSGETFVKMGEKDSDCNCYCIEFETNNKTELCLSEAKSYIIGRYSKSGKNLNIYYVSPSNRNTIEDLPWEDFDTTTPIAVLSPDENGNMELDWKGFSIDGKLAVDYAIYGKKTLEGTYQKQ